MRAMQCAGAAGCLQAKDRACRIDVWTTGPRPIRTVQSLPCLLAAAWGCRQYTQQCASWIGISAPTAETSPQPQVHDKIWWLRSTSSGYGLVSASLFPYEPDLVKVVWVQHRHVCGLGWGMHLAQHLGRKGLSHLCRTSRQTGPGRQSVTTCSDEECSRVEGMHLDQHLCRKGCGNQRHGRKHRHIGIMGQSVSAAAQRRRPTAPKHQAVKCLSRELSTPGTGHPPCPQ